MVVSSEITFRLRLSWSLVACLPGRRASLILVVVESNSSGCCEMISLCNGRKQEARVAGWGSSWPPSVQSE